jgi:hypothetical protein
VFLNLVFTQRRKGGKDAKKKSALIFSALFFASLRETAWFGGQVRFEIERLMKNVWTDSAS